MKILLFILLSGFFISCDNTVGFDKIHLPPENSQIIIIKLADSLGNVTITLPQRYDTTFSWTDYSDCGKPCNKIKYRSQPKALPIIKESGFIKTHEGEESVESFTISHSAEFPFHDAMDSVGISRNLQWRKQYVENEMHLKIKSDAVERIGKRYFAILTVDYYDSSNNVYSKQLLATTTIKGNPIFLDFQLLTKKRDSLTNNFIENAKYYLRTASIDNGM